MHVRLPCAARSAIAARTRSTVTLPLHLREHAEHAHHSPARWRRRVYRLGITHKGNVMLPEQLGGGVQVHDAAREPRERRTSSTSYCSRFAAHSSRRIAGRCLMSFALIPASSYTRTISCGGLPPSAPAPPAALLVSILHAPGQALTRECRCYSHVITLLDERITRAGKAKKPRAVC